MLAIRQKIKIDVARKTSTWNIQNFPTGENFCAFDILKIMQKQNELNKLKKSDWKLNWFSCHQWRIFPLPTHHFSTLINPLPISHHSSECVNDMYIINEENWEWEEKKKLPKISKNKNTLMCVHWILHWQSILWRKNKWEKKNAREKEVEVTLTHKIYIWHDFETLNNPSMYLMMKKDLKKMYVGWNVEVMNKIKWNEKHEHKSSYLSKIFYFKYWLNQF